MMDLLEGVTLPALLDDMQGDLPSAVETFAVLRGVGDALGYAHAKGVHSRARLVGTISSRGLRDESARYVARVFAAASHHSSGRTPRLTRWPTRIRVTTSMG